MTIDPKRIIQRMVEKLRGKRVLKRQRSNFERKKLSTLGEVPELNQTKSDALEVVKVEEPIPTLTEASSLELPSISKEGHLVTLDLRFQQPRQKRNGQQPL